MRDSARAFRDLDRLQIHEIWTLQLPHLLRYENCNSMSHSVETRLLFLDYRIVEFCISIPAGHKIYDGWTKNVLRRAMQDVLLPEVTWRRDKLGFKAPERTWIGQVGPLMKSPVAPRRPSSPRSPTAGASSPSTIGCPSASAGDI